MTSLEELSELFNDVGTQTVEIDEISLHAESPTWAVAFEDSVVVEVLFDEERGVLTLTSNLGEPRTEDAFPVYEALLLFNSLRSSTGGVTAALTEPNGELELAYDLDVRDVSVPIVQTVLLNFAAKTRAWREVVETGGVDQEAKTFQHNGDFASSIRV